MLWILGGIIIGIIIGLASNITIPIEYARYTAVAILAILDSLIGAGRAYVNDRDRHLNQSLNHDQTSADQYNSKIFITGLFINTTIA